ncbi:MAG: class I SAM-dependent methyltransferase [Chloroflexi bacterium]|nr:class I SAM-dependent methyltransferase [Chloroflexota bacterium]
MDRSLAAGFDSVAGIYDAARPGYPSELFDEILAAAAGSAPPRVLEIGCGTGKATLPFAARGCQVTALDLSPAMAARAREKLAPYPHVQVITGAFEDVSLPPGSFDIVCSATAFHWIDPAVGLAKVHSLLRPGGVIALFQHVQVRGDGSPDFFLESQPVFERLGLPFDAAPAPPRTTVPTAHEAEIRASGLFADIATHRYDWDQVYDAASYELLVRTYSNVIDLESNVREALIAGLRAMIDGQFGGKITRPLVVTLVIGRRA